MTATIQEAFGHVIGTLRTERSMSQEALANQCGIHRTYVAKLEGGEHSPTLTMIWALATALGVAPSELVRRVEELVE